MSLHLTFPEYQVELIKVQKSDKYLLKIEHRALYISELLFIIIREYLNDTSEEKITQILNDELPLSEPYTTPLIQKIIRENVLPLELKTTSKDRNSETSRLNQYIKHKLVLLTFSHMKGMLKLLKPLFQPVIFSILFALSVVSSLAYLFSSGFDSANFVNVFNQSLGFYLFSLFCFFVIMLLHEIGHAAATYVHGIKPKEIGTGLYLFFPVFYTDVTNIWGLSPLQRVQVNLSGLYVQLMINVGFILGVISSVDPAVIQVLNSLIVLNLMSMFYNLNPFFKFDGYWVYSDLFRIPNLKGQSNRLIIHTLNKLSGKKNEPQTEVLKPALIVYTICYLLFLSFVFYKIGNFLPAYFLGLTDQFSQLLESGLRTDNLQFAFKDALILFFIGYAIVRLIRFLNQFIRRKIAQA